MNNVARELRYIWPDNDMINLHVSQNVDLYTYLLIFQIIYNVISLLNLYLYLAIYVSKNMRESKNTGML